MLNPVLCRRIYSKKYILDSLKSYLAASYGVARKLSYRHIYAMRVRRSSDNAEMDIGFSGGQLDVAGLLSWSGTDSVYCVTLYDATGNGNHVTNSTTANQPRIVNAGIVERDFDAAKCAVLWPTFASASGVTLVREGNFPDASEWAMHTGGASISASNNTLSFEGDGTNAIVISKQDISIACVTGRKYFVTCKIRVTNNSCANFYPYLAGITGGSSLIVQTITSPTQNQWYTVSGIVTISDQTGNISLRIRHSYADNATANGKVMEVQEVVCIDVTNYGKPCLSFDGSNDVLINSANQASIDILAQPLYLNSVFSTDSAIAANGYLICKNVDSTATQQYTQIFDYTNMRLTSLIEGDGANYSHAGNNSIVKGIQTIQALSWQNNLMQSYGNSVVAGATNTYNGSLTSRSLLHIGARGTTAGGQATHFKGKFTEAHILKGNPQHINFTLSQKKFYSIA